MSAISTNPWIREGVSILSKDTKDLLPLVGQKELFIRLKKYCQECNTEAGSKLSSFFVLHGGSAAAASQIFGTVLLPLSLKCLSSGSMTKHETMPSSQSHHFPEPKQGFHKAVDGGGPQEDNAE